MELIYKMNKRTLAKIFLCIVIAYFFLAISFYFIGGDQLHKKIVTTEDMVTATDIVGEIKTGDILEQPFCINAKTIESISLKIATYNRENIGNLLVSICDGKNRVIGSAQVPINELEDNTNADIYFSSPINIVPNEPLVLRIESDGTFGNAITVYYGSTISLVRGSVDKIIFDDQKAMINGKSLDGILCYQIKGQIDLLFGEIYWHLAISVGVILIIYCLYLFRKNTRGETSLVIRFFEAIKKYSFLFQQLIMRDFKAKYKRSILGILWSFLNPLLMMLIYYVVFSTIFKSNIENFPAYLIIGVVCFNFFNEATSMSLQSIVGNASLITKVYIPKYIYPVSRVASSTINLLFSLIPLLFVLILTGASFRIQYVLAIYGFVCLIALALGVGMMLASLMVFFRDTQFLWSIIITILNFATPIFYPESIIQDNYMLVYKMNPLYHIIGFIRVVLMDSVSPEPMRISFVVFQL